MTFADAFGTCSTPERVMMSEPGLFRYGLTGMETLPMPYDGICEVRSCRSLHKARQVSVGVKPVFGSGHMNIGGVTEKPVQVVYGLFSRRHLQYDPKKGIDAVDKQDSKMAG